MDPPTPDPDYFSGERPFERNAFTRLTQQFLSKGRCLTWLLTVAQHQRTYVKLLFNLFMKGFLRAQISYLWRTLPYRHGWRYKLWTFVDGARLFMGYIRLTLTLRFSRGGALVDGKSCVVVLLTHNRPQNMSFLVNGALRNRFITRVIVSNSNPKVKIRDWITSTDSRLMLIDEKVPTQPGHRLILARQTGAEYVLSVDDDIFLTPKQWRKFFEFLLSDEECPHGLIGQVWRPGTKSSNGSPFHHLIAEDKNVDVLIGAYAFTHQQLSRVFELATSIGVPDLSQVRNGEDILLSFSGTCRPRIHSMKPVLFCASEGLPGIALWKSEHRFWEQRVDLFQKTRDARLSMRAPWGNTGVHVELERTSITA
jgi:hypothetical protein